ncbi:adhesion and hyphal regulator 1 [[Candida] railenensis]|uniref:Adhesion and hyphal regulator 1 n=1 Tax=[Candida] railenensis TaxID=45579 RepID=A0A9P0QU38_9ASCO|nr:adhesion and hyphal regulator 1 [[Candida] railenensis]
MPRSSKGGRRSRTRSGCLTCRDRHMKCDEQQPVCKNCIKSKRKCYRGVRLNFTQYTIYKPENKPPLPAFPRHYQFRFLDQSITIASLYEKGRSYYEPYMNLHTSESLRESEFMFQEEMYLLHSIPAAHEQVRGGSSVGPESLNLSSSHSHQIIETHDSNNQIISQDRFQYSQFTRPPQGRVTDWNSHLDVQRQAELVHSPMSVPTLVPRLPDVAPIPEEAEASDQDVEVADLLEYYESPSFEITPNFPNFMDSISGVDTKLQAFIELIQDQKYYWILDLFNEISLWQQIIPYYCLKTVEDNSKKISSDLASFQSFLMDCLLCCSINGPMSDENLLQRQLKLWKSSESEQFPNDNSIKVAISIVLILLGIYLKFQNNKNMDANERNDNGGGDQFSLDRSRDIIFQQIQLFNELMSKVNLKQYSATAIPLIRPPLLLISSFHSILILKFLLAKENVTSTGLNQFEIEFLQAPQNFEIRQFKKNNHLNERNMDDSVGASSTNTSRSSFSEMNSNHLTDRASSISNLSSSRSLSNMIPGSKPVGTIPSTSNFATSFKSEAYKLRQVMWRLIKLDYSFRFKDFTTFELNDFTESQENLGNMKGDMSTGKDDAILFTNDRGIAISLLQEYSVLLASSKNGQINEMASNRLSTIFSTIHNSFATSDLKFKWKSHFNWALDRAN